MKNFASSEFTAQLILELKKYLVLCEEALLLAVHENQVLSGQDDYKSSEFQQKRRNLIPDLQSICGRLRDCRMQWQQVSPQERDQLQEVKPLFQQIQGYVMKLLQLDRENQQAMLRRGLVPVQHLPAAAAVQQPHFVANLYRRNSA
jgi:hypothetical protein